MVQATLSHRKEAILFAVIVEYIRTAQPVGSQHVLETTSLSISPASVRAQMAELERDGYLVQPHVSAGRVPSSRGYRYFVDRLMRVDPVEIRALEHKLDEFLGHARGQVDEVLERALTFLARQTDYTAVLATWNPSSERFKAVQVVSLAEDMVLVVVVGSRGTLERTSFMPRTTVDDRLAVRAGNYVTDELAGRSFSDPIEIPTTGDAELDDVVEQVVGALGFVRLQDEAELRVRELNKTAAALDQLDKVARVLETLDDQLAVIRLIRSLVAEGTHVAIGEESGLESLADCSLVLAPCEVDGELVGSIGLLGPTRMDYPRATSTVEALASRVAQSVR
jgi:heat-inducible transcriptional repressor